METDDDRRPLYGHNTALTRGYPQVEKWSEYTKRVCEHRYGRAPRVTINGHLNAHFAYLEQPLGYILSELIKNAMRATLENHVNDTHVPDISVTIGESCSV